MNSGRKIIILISALGLFLAAAVICFVFIFGGVAKSSSADIPSSDIISVSEPASSEEVSSEEPSSETVSSEPEIKKLDVTSPREDVTVYKDNIAIKGSADPNIPLYINEKEISVGDDGIFAETVSLDVGNNWFTVKQGEYEYKCVVRYRKIVILEVSPTDSLTLDGGSFLTVRARALAGSSVSATWNGKTITLEERHLEQQDDEYSDYFGRFEMPINYEKSVTYSAIAFKATSKAGTGKTEGSKITVRKAERPPEEDYYVPTGKNYIDVGHTYIAEVICRSAEVMNVDDNIDYSRPTNNYLPKGTVDYCSATENTNGDGLKFRTLRYGKQLYTKTSGAGENIKVYDGVNNVYKGGSLPDRNRLNIAGFSSDGRHTTLTLDVDWKAPFYFDLYPQKYTNVNSYGGEKELDYTISASTFTYIDITFCYAEALTGELLLDGNKVFKSYEIIENESDYTLRLHLKEKGKFYGWSAEYNANDQLVFSFLNPAVLKEADNEYGYSLEGITILIDAGHGGEQTGTYGYDNSKPEKVLTLMLAQKLEERLKAYGATVIMTRDDDSTVEAEERMNLLRDTKPDFAISIHRNASSSSTPSAFNSYHFTAFSADAAKHIYNETEKEGLYKTTKWSGVKWHYFFLARCTECPSVLTENGFMTNREEFNKIINPEFNDDCADALASGIFAYFISIQ